LASGDDVDDELMGTMWFGDVCSVGGEAGERRDARARRVSCDDERRIPMRLRNLLEERE
jgi:hypothetical protein